MLVALLMQDRNKVIDEALEGKRKHPNYIHLMARTVSVHK